MPIVSRLRLSTALAVVVLVFLTAGPAVAQTRPAGGAVVALGYTPIAYERDTTRSLLLQELARQAVLVAARDGLGAATRDQCLREPFGADALVFDLSTRAVVGKGVHVKLTRRPAAAGEPQVVFEADAPLPATLQQWLDFGPPTTTFEAWSRVELVEALKKAGVPDARKPAAFAATKPAGGDRIGVAAFDLGSMFATVRDAHAQADLPTLARGYAHLGHETRFLWSGTAHAFTARGLLYAERMVAAGPDGAGPLYYRGYARSLAGTHATALADLDEADRRAAAAKLAAPAWAALARAHSRYDTAELLKAADADAKLAPLASLLALSTLDVEPSASMHFRVGGETIKRNPTSLAALDDLAQKAGVSAGHMVTELAPAMVASLLADEVRRIPGMPPAARAAIGIDADPLADPARAAAAAAALVDAGAVDRGEPSLAALGRAVQDAQVVHAFRRIDFLTDRLGVDADDFVASQRPVFAAHPLGPLMSAYASRQEDDAIAALKALPTGDLVRRPQPLFKELMSSGTGAVRAVLFGIGNRFSDDMEPTAWSIEPNTAGVTKWEAKTHVPFVRRVEEFSPHSPTVPMVRLKVGDPTPEEAAQIERRLGHVPVVAAGLYVYHYMRRDDPAVVRSLELYLATAPDQWAFDALSDTYRKLGDDEKWVATKKRVLKEPDYGLTHASANRDIAYHYMAKGDYATAEPFAEAAASSFAAWALDCFMQCEEGLGKWDVAEKVLVARLRRYGGSPQDWYGWCLRTGKGEVQTARKVAEREFQQMAAGGDRDREVLLKVYGWYALEGKPLVEAAALLKQHVLDSGDALAGLYAAMAYANAGDVASRDAMLDAVIAKGPKHQVNNRVRTELVEMAKFLRVGVAPKNPPTAVFSLALKAPPGERQNGFYVAGLIYDYYKMPGHANWAYANGVVEQRWGSKATSSTYGSMALRARGHDPIDVKAMDKLARTPPAAAAATKPAEK